MKNKILVLTIPVLLLFMGQTSKEKDLDSYEKYKLLEYQLNKLKNELDILKAKVFELEDKKANKTDIRQKTDKELFEAKLRKQYGLEEDHQHPPNPPHSHHHIHEHRDGKIYHIWDPSLQP